MDKITTDDAIKIGGAVLGVVALYKVADTIGDLFNSDGDKDDPRLPPEINPEDIKTPPTLTTQGARWIADAIYSAIYGDGSFWSGRITENEDVVIQGLTVAKNDADVLAIADAYGRRGKWWLIGVQDLSATVSEYLSSDDVEAVNSNYRRKGINIQFAQ